MTRFSNIMSLPRQPIESSYQAFAASVRRPRLELCAESRKRKTQSLHPSQPLVEATGKSHFLIRSTTAKLNTLQIIDQSQQEIRIKDEQIP